MKISFEALIEYNKYWSYFYRLIQEVRELKDERERKALMFQWDTEREKEISKQRLNEIERKLKTSENQRSNMLFNFEKEKAKWALEKDNLLSEIDNLTESLKKIKRKRDAVVKDNEKLKHDHKSKTRYMQSSILGSGHKDATRASKRAEFSLLDSASKTKFAYAKSPRSGHKYIGDYSIHKSLSKMK